MSQKSNKSDQKKSITIPLPRLPGFNDYLLRQVDLDTKKLAYFLLWFTSSLFSIYLYWLEINNFIIKKTFCSQVSWTPISNFLFSQENLFLIATLTLTVYIAIKAYKYLQDRIIFASRWGLFGVILVFLSLFLILKVACNGI